MTSIYASNATWLQTKHAFSNGQLVVIPLGAGCKEHGLHLPNNTDQLQADYFTAELAQRHSLVIMPTLTYAHYPAFVDYAGSTSLTNQNCIDQYVDICSQLHNQGATGFYFVNFGVSTTPSLESAQALLHEKNILMRFTDFSVIDLNDIEKQAGGTHADEIETSVMLHIKPNVVQMNKAEKDFDDKPGKLSPIPPPNGSKDAYSPTGAWGDPTLASAEKGQVIAERYLKLLDDDINQTLQLINNTST